MRFFILLLLLSTLACTSEESTITNPQFEPEDELVDEERFALVTRVTVTGEENNYTFNVTLSSPDTGCSQYADWWEILDIEEEIIYRRIFSHSHVTEQPFTRSGGPVRILANQLVYIRGHMNNNSFTSRVFAGTVNDGFQEVEYTVSTNLEAQDPLPEGCDF